MAAEHYVPAPGIVRLREVETEVCAATLFAGQSRFSGKAAVREGLATRFKGLPDVHYSDDRHWVSGNLGVSEWLLTGTLPDGTRLQVRGCDHWEFRGGKVIRKDSYWKIVESPK